MTAKVRIVDENGNDAACYRCGKLAVAFVNTTMDCASSVPSVFKPICEDHGRFITSEPITIGWWVER